jgi:hypothetical protein
MNGMNTDGSTLLFIPDRNDRSKIWVIKKERSEGAITFLTGGGATADFKDHGWRITKGDTRNTFVVKEHIFDRDVALIRRDKEGATFEVLGKTPLHMTKSQSKKKSWTMKDTVGRELCELAYLSLGLFRKDLFFTPWQLLSSDPPPELLAFVMYFCVYRLT